MANDDVEARNDGPEPFTIRRARPDDCETIANLVRELAIYEELEHMAQATSADFRLHLFGPRPLAEAILAVSRGETIGLALFFHTFSTWTGKPGLYLEDLFVRAAGRSQGVGKALLASIARIAEERGCARVEWSVLDWNTPAIGFYVSLGAQPMSSWTVYRIDDGSLRQLATLAPALSRSDTGETPPG